MRLDVFRWQIKQDYPPTLRADDTAQPFSTVYVKAIDCAGDNYPMFMGAFDPQAPNSLDELRLALNVYRDQGLGAVPWGVSRGYFPYEEGVMAGNCAGQETNGVYILDLEPYDRYWENRDPAGVRRWLEGFHAGGGRELWISTDSRQGKPQEVMLNVWLEDPIVTRIMPQAYWTDFGQPWQAGIEAAYLPLDAMGIPASRVFPTYPLDANLTDLRAAIAWSQQTPAFGGISLWRRGIAQQPVLDALLADPQPVFEGGVPFPVPLPPAPPVDDHYAEAFKAGLRRAITLLTEELEGK